MSYDADNDRFHVTVSLAAGREVSGRRRLARNDIRFRAGNCIYINLSEIFSDLTWSDMHNLASVVQQDCWRYLLQGGVQVFLLVKSCLCIPFGFCF